MQGHFSSAPIDREFPPKARLDDSETHAPWVSIERHTTANPHGPRRISYFTACAVLRPPLQILRVAVVIASTRGAVSRSIGVCLVAGQRGPSICRDCWEFESLGDFLSLDFLPLTPRQTAAFSVVEHHPYGMDGAADPARLSVLLASWPIHDGGVFHATHKVRISSSRLSANWTSQLVTHRTASGGTAGELSA